MKKDSEDYIENDDLKNEELKHFFEKDCFDNSLECGIDKSQSLAKKYWYFGEWQALIEMDIEAFDSKCEVAELYAMKASAYQQLDDLVESKKYYILASELGCSNELISKLLIAGIHNSLGKISALVQDSEKVEYHFMAAVSIEDNSDHEKLAKPKRVFNEITRLGLMQQAGNILSSELDDLSINALRPSEMKSKLATLASEIELINHQLKLSYQKSQLYIINKESSLYRNIDGSVNVKELKKLSPSQLGQDVWALEKNDFKKSGFFVEFGATDGVLLSNTYLLEKEFLWDGICAEPNPKFYKELKKNRSCTISNACISGNTGDIVEFILANEYGGIAESAKRGKHKSKVEAYEISNKSLHLKTISLDDFLQENNAPEIIDYLSIDTEGSEYEILSSFPFDKWFVRCLSVEHNFGEQRELIYKLLSSLGYTRVACEWDDLYYKS